MDKEFEETCMKRRTKEIEPYLKGKKLFYLRTREKIPYSEISCL